MLSILQVVINIHGKSVADQEDGFQNKAGHTNMHVVLVDDCDSSQTGVGQGASPGEKGGQLKFQYDQSKLPNHGTQDGQETKCVGKGAKLEQEGRKTINNMRKT